MMMNGARRGRIYIGPSGWSYPDWSGNVYPPNAGSRFDALTHLSRYFRAIEVNSSYYRPPNPRTSASWVRRVHDPKGFLFTVKLHQRFTHVREEYGRADIAEFKNGIAPIVEAGLLGCILMQFPWSFRCNGLSLEWLARLADDFGEYPLAVEVRHTSWDRPDVRAKLRDMRLSYCNIDQPLLPQCLPPAAHVTGPIGYVRLHGRRYDTWFNDNVEPHERYDYLYRPGELHEWMGRIRELAGQTETLFVFANNHYKGQGPANALQLRAMVEGREVDVPESMLHAFPFLREIARPIVRAPEPHQPTLFDQVTAIRAPARPHERQDASTHEGTSD